MKGRRDQHPSCCHFHPEVVLVGVCHLCLSEKLVVLAAKQSLLRSISASARRPRHRHHQPSSASSKKTHINIPKIFAIGSLLNRIEFRHWRTENLDGTRHASSSPEGIFTDIDDSFISIKLEDNGVASWEKNKVSKISLDNCNIPWNHKEMVSKAPALKDAKTTTAAKSTSVVEHSKPREASLRWQKRIGHLFHLIRWKRSNKAGSVCHVGSKADGVKVRNGWMRTLTKRIAKE